MQESAAATVGGIAQPAGVPKSEKANGLLRKLIMLYVWGSAAEVAVVFFLVWLGLEFTNRQLVGLLLITPFAVPFYVLIDNRAGPWPSDWRSRASRRRCCYSPTAASPARAPRRADRATGIACEGGG